MSETMDITRRIAYVAFAGVLLTAGIALNDRRYPATPAWKTELSPSTTALDAELGAEAAHDCICNVVPDANRKRFLESGILYQDRVTGAAPWPRAESAGQPQ